MTRTFAFALVLLSLIFLSAGIQFALRYHGHMTLGTAAGVAGLMAAFGLGARWMR